MNSLQLIHSSCWCVTALLTFLNDQLTLVSLYVREDCVTSWQNWGTFDPTVSSSMCDREPLITLLYVGLWSGCYIPRCFVRVPLTVSGVWDSTPPGRMLFVCFTCLFVFVCLCVLFLYHCELSERERVTQQAMLTSTCSVGRWHSCWKHWSIIQLVK